MAIVYVSYRRGPDLALSLVERRRLVFARVMATTGRERPWKRVVPGLTIEAARRIAAGFAEAGEAFDRLTASGG